MNPTTPYNSGYIDGWKNAEAKYQSENAKLKEALGKANDTTIDKLLMEFQDAAQEGENFTLADIESILYDNYSQLKDNGTKKAD